MVIIDDALHERAHIDVGISTLQLFYRCLVDLPGIEAASDHLEQERPIGPRFVDLGVEAIEVVLVLPLTWKLENHQKVPQFTTIELYRRGGHEHQALGVKLETLHRQK